MFNLVFEQIQTGGDRNFGYLVGCRKSGKAALIDPSYQPALLVERAAAQGLNVEYIINTHGHSDHTNGNEAANGMTGAKICAFRQSEIRHEISLQDSSVFPLGHFNFQIYHSPGHSPDHIIVYIPDYQIAVTGDQLFVGKIGGTENEAAARLQYESLQRLLQILPEAATIWPGHNYGCRPSSTIALEKECNPFLHARDFTEFLEMKARWGSFKKEYGLL